MQRPSYSMNAGVLLGSTNLDFQSLRYNDEGNVGILDSGFASQMKEIFEEDLKQSSKIERKEWLRRPWGGLDRDGDRALVVDYKSGKPTPFGKKNRSRRLVAAGERLQLPVYALAARLLGARRVASEYLFVEEAAGGTGQVTQVPFDEEETDAAVGSLREVLRLIDEAVGKGLFLPKTRSLRSKEPCRTCDFRDICGPGHERLYERKWAGEIRTGESNPLLGLREIR